MTKASVIAKARGLPWPWILGALAGLASATGMQWVSGGSRIGTLESQRQLDLRAQLVRDSLQDVATRQMRDSLFSLVGATNQTLDALALKGCVDTHEIFVRSQLRCGERLSRVGR